MVLSFVVAIKNASNKKTITNACLSTRSCRVH